MIDPISDTKPMLATVVPSVDPCDWANWLLAEHRSKWRSDDEVRRRAAKHFMDKSDGIGLGCTPEEVCAAFASLKKAHRCDHDGVLVTCL